MQISKLPQELRVFLQVSFGLTLLCALIEAICRWGLHLGYPYNWPLLFPHSNFFDFEAYFDQFHRLHTSSFFEGQYLMMYPAPVVVCYRFFYLFQPFATRVFLAFLLMSLIVAAGLVARALIRRGLATGNTIGLIGATFLLSYPIWFEIKQANTEIIVWILVSSALYFFFKDRGWTAAALIGVAGAMKFYPIIYLGLLLSQKRYRACIFGCVVAAATMLLALWFVGPTVPIAWAGTKIGMAQSHNDYLIVLRRNEQGFDHSLFGLVKVLMAVSRGGKLAFTEHTRSLLLSLYLLTVSLAGVVLYFARIRRLPMVNQVICLTIASILFPPMSFDYTLLHLYAPWTLLALLAIRAELLGERLPALLPAFVVLAICASPLSELIVHHERVGGQLRAIALLYFFIVACRVPFRLANDATYPSQQAPAF